MFKKRNPKVSDTTLYSFVEAGIYLIIILLNTCFPPPDVVSLRELYLPKQADKQNENYLD